MHKRGPEGHPGATYCPVRETMDLLGQKWTLHIIRELVTGKRRFNELAHALGGVNSRTLSKRLDTLQTAGLISRIVRSDIPPWVEYEVTQKGRTLNEVVEAIADWGRRWMEKPIQSLRRPQSRPRARRTRPVALET